MSTPNEFNFYSPYVKLTENTFLSQVNESVLESVHFQPRFRVRCAVKYVNIHASSPAHKKQHQQQQEQQEILTLKSDYLEIVEAAAAAAAAVATVVDGEEEEQEQYSSKCMQLWQEKTADLVDQMSPSDKSMSYFYAREPASTHSANMLNLLPLTYLKFSKPFIAQADYVSAEFITNNPSLVDAEYLNYIRISVQVPYIDGFVPIISTQALHNYRYLLNDEINYASTDHVCSNFVDLKSRLTKNVIKYGFLKNISNSDIATEALSKHRNPKSLEFYSNLDKAKCLWHFVAYYDISELTTHCQAQIMSSDSSETAAANKNDDEFDQSKSYLTIRVPLFVSYLYASDQGSWSSIDYRTSVEASIIYKTRSFQVNENGQDPNSVQFYDEFKHNGLLYSSESSSSSRSNNSVLGKSVSSDQNLISLTVTKIGLVENGKLSIEFATVPSFHGQFIKQHLHLATMRSAVIAPDNTEFNLDLVWSQYTYDYPEQTWRATSSSVLNVRNFLKDVIFFFLCRKFKKLYWEELFFPEFFR